MGLPRKARDQPHVAGIAQFYLAVRRDHQTAATQAADFCRDSFEHRHKTWPWIRISRSKGIRSVVL
jgi:hypothetical protein